MTGYTVENGNCFIKKGKILNYTILNSLAVVFVCKLLRKSDLKAVCLIFGDVFFKHYLATNKATLSI